MEDVIKMYRRGLEIAHKQGKTMTFMRELAKSDLFFLLYWVCGRKDIEHPWLFDRCREVQRNPDGFLDLWAREHYKSTFITYGLTMQDILNDPEITCCILSFNRPTAQAFLKQIKREFESNENLKSLFPDVLYADPKKESPKWSEDEGIIVKRKGNPKEATVEAFGLIDGQPTSKHYKLLVYNDVVTRESVATPYMIKKTTDAWELSHNLGSDGGKVRYEGTRYHYNDTYREIIAREAAVPRIYPGTLNGKPDGEPVMWTPQLMAKKRRDMGPYTFNCQILQDPKADDNQSFNDGWVKYWPAQQYRGMNIYILADPANEKKKENDYSVFWVVGLGADRNYYVITCVRDRLNLVERANVLFTLYRDYRPLNVGYERYGMQADIQHYQTRMDRDNFRFGITELGGNMPKPDRIKMMIPVWEQGRFYLPESIMRRNYEGVTEDLVRIFLADEYKAFPFCIHDDMLDCLSRILDPKLGATFPDFTDTIIGNSKLGLASRTNETVQDEAEYNPLTFGLGGVN